MNYAEQIAAFEARKKALADSNDEIMEAAGKEGATLDAEQKAQFDENEADIAEIDDHLTRLRAQEKRAKEKAVPAKGDNPEDAGQSRGGTRIQVQTKKLEPGIAFARALMCFYKADGVASEAISIAKSRYGDNDPSVGALVQGSMGGRKLGIEKATVPAGATVSGNWAENLVGDETSAYADFVEYLRPMTILGKFGTDGVPSLRSVPFNTPLITQSVAGSGAWVGEGAGIPLTKGGFTRTTLTPLKVGAICALTADLLRSSSPAAEQIVRNDLAAALAYRLDADFIDPTKTASSGVSPASITNGAQAIAATTYTDSDDIRTDYRSLMAYFTAAENPPTTGVWIMSANNALALSTLVNGLGQPEFPGITMNGGTFFGLPVIVSSHVGTYVALVNATDIYLGDEGGVEIDLSTEASLEMKDSSLTNEVTTPTQSQATVSMFQTDSVAIRAKRTINWSRRRSSGVVYLTGVAWGGAVNSS